MAGRGSKPGERRGGRQKGTRNKVTAEIKTYAMQFGPQAFDRIVKLGHSPDERVSLAACQEVLNRAYGKAPQPQTGENGEGPVSVRLEVGWLPSVSSAS